MVPLTAQEMTQRVGMRPTLLIGVGGTGQKVLVQLKARFIRNYGQVPTAVEFLCFDTDQSAEQTQVNGQIVRLTSDTELINIGGIQTANIIRNLDKYQAIGAWITEDKERIPTSAIQMGAKQVRPLGRLSLFWHVETITRKLQSSVQRLTDLKLSFDKKGINVFIISSVCGGTGSGSIIDMAYLTRNVIDKAGIDSEFCYINGVLGLPSVFPNVDKTGIESNAYATLTELDYFIQNGEWTIDYGNPRVPTFSFSGIRPFNICYLIDARNEQGQGLSGLDEIAPMLAEAVYLQISSQVGNANNSAFDNVRVLTGSTIYHDEGKEKPTAYSSLGTTSLVFPVTKIIDICAHRLGHDLIQEELLKKDVTPSKADAAVNSFMQANQLDPEGLLGQIARDAKNNVMRITLDPRKLDQFKENDMAGATMAYLTKAENTVDNEFFLALDSNKKLLSERLAVALDTEINRLADDPIGGLYYAIAILEKLDATLAAERGDMDKSRAEMDVRRDRAQAMLRQTQDEFARSFRSNILGRSGRIKDARNRHVEMFQNYLAARFESRKREIAIALLAGLSSSLQNKRALLQRTVDRLQFINSQFEAYLERFGSGKPRTDFVLAQDISTDQDIEHFYKEHYDRLGGAPASALLDSQGPLHAWLESEQEQIADKILAHARSVFEDLKSISIEQIILDKKDQVEPRKRLQDLINRSVPFWMYRTAGVLGQDWAGEEKIVVIGVPDKDRSIYKGAEEGGQQLVSTFDPHQITVLQTKHGIPLFALTQYRDFKQSHDHVMHRGLKPLYVFPEVRPGGEKAKQVFALGVAYGFIFKSGVYYHIIPEDPGHAPIRMDQGMSESLRGFRNNDELINYIAKSVEDQISREGVEAAIQVLDSFVKEPFVYELKGGAARTNIDRTSISRDTSVGKTGSVNFDLILELRDTIKDYIKKVLRA